MPIVSVNPDGTVTIARKSGRDKKTVRPEELAQYNPALLEDYNKFSEEKRTLESGGIKPSAEQEKQTTKLSTVEVNVNELEKQLNQIGGASRGKLGGTLGKLLAGATGGEINPDVADYEALRKALIGPLARAISGEVGVLTDRDIARAEGLLPKVTDSKKLAKRKLENLRSITAAQKGVVGGGLPPLNSFFE